MISFYIIEKCPKCGVEIPIEHGYSCGFDASFNMVVDVICRKEDCLNEFKINFNDKKYNIIDVDLDEFEQKNNIELVDFNSYNEYQEKMITYIKKYNK